MAEINVSFSYWSNTKNTIKAQGNKGGKEKIESSKIPQTNKKELPGTQGLFLTELENLQKNRNQNQT